MIAVSEGRAAGVVAEEDQGLAAVHRGLVGHWNRVLEVNDQDYDY